MTLDAARGLLACPHCAEPLAAEARRWVCPRGHSFDVARQGYLNLAGGPEPANADTAAMLDARARVQASGLFDVVTDALDEVVPASAQRLLEVGAGTGHYLAGLLNSRPDARGIALDVSRAAARRAARAHPAAASVVADVWRGLPIRTGAMDVLLCIFAPRNPAEFARVLAPGGLLVVATPAPDHLAGLRSHYGLLGLEEDKQTKLIASLADRFHLDRSVTARAGSILEPPLVDDLIGMGPNAHHSPPRATRAEHVEIAVEVTAFTARRRQLELDDLTSLVDELEAEGGPVDDATVATYAEEMR